MRGMKSLLNCFVAAIVIAMPSLAFAGGAWVLHSDWSVEIGETQSLRALVSDPDAATPIPILELAEQRGGVRGTSFSIHFDGMVNGSSGEGILHLIGPGGVIATDGVPNPGANPGVDIQSFLGNVGPFQGLGQWAIVNGNGNDVSNSLTVNIYVTDGTGALTTFTDVLSTIDVTGP